jgi:hypothetical protein
MCMFCRSLFVLLYFFTFGHCVVCSYIRILISPLVSSNSSNTLQWPVHLSAVPQDGLGYFRVLKSPSCMGLYVIRVSMSLGLTSIVHGSLCCPSSYIIWSHFRSVWVFMLSQFLYHLVLLPFCMSLYVFRLSMSLCLTSVL